MLSNDPNQPNPGPGEDTPDAIPSHGPGQDPEYPGTGPVEYPDDSPGEIPSIEPGFPGMPPLTD